jgi:hypothetical protein
VKVALVWLKAFRQSRVLDDLQAVGAGDALLFGATD